MGRPGRGEVLLHPRSSVEQCRGLVRGFMTRLRRFLHSTGEVRNPRLGDGTLVGTPGPRIGSWAPPGLGPRATWETNGGEMDTSWMAQGLCRFEPPSTFFPSDGVGVETAKRICASCPVKEPCLEYALEHRIDHGVWGGTSERQRRRILKKRKLSPAPLVSSLL